jgi:hypothetical protein
MNRRDVLKVILSGCAVSFTPSVFQGSAIAMESNESSSRGSANPKGEMASSKTPAFQWLRTGDVKPAGWIKAQMLRDLQLGFAGCLDKLSHEASSDIFVSGRNSSQTQNNQNEMGVNWWNGETEGNWRAGHIMMAYLSEDPASMQEADRYVKHVLASQDADGYLGVFAPDLRYAHQGELWTQTCLLRGLIAYAELTHNDDALHAIRRAVDLTIQTYRSGNHSLPVGESHDLMFVEVLERMHDLTGDPKYPEFALWFYEQWSENESKWDATLPSLLDLQKGFVDHGVHTYENVRVPIWLAATTGRDDIREAAQNAFVKIARYTEPSGSGVSQEWIKDLSPDPSKTEYEYCATKELQLTFESALQKTGNSVFGDRAEWIWFNAAQGSRLADGTAISYLTSDNRYRCDGRSVDGKKPEKRNKFSPAHIDVAVCCNPNASQVAALFVRGMWMRDAHGLAAMLYGPCMVDTRVAGTRVRIEERTQYPFETSVEIAVHPERPLEFPLRLRNPLWSRQTRVQCAGAKVERDGEYWVVRKTWHAGDTVHIEFTPQVEPIAATNGEIALRYGAILFAAAIPSKESVVKRYAGTDLHDSYYEPLSEAGSAEVLAVSAAQFVVERSSGSADPLHPFDTPMIELRTRDTGSPTGEKSEITLVPFGNAPVLRRVTFPAKGGASA